MGHPDEDQETGTDCADDLTVHGDRCSGDSLDEGSHGEIVAQVRASDAHDRHRPVIVRCLGSATNPWSFASIRVMGTNVPPGRSSTAPHDEQTAWWWRSWARW